MLATELGGATSTSSTAAPLPAPNLATLTVPSVNLPASSAGVNSPGKNAVVVSQNRLAFVRSTGRDNATPRITAAFFLGLAAILVYIIARRLRLPYASLLAEFPCLHWLQLGGLCLLFLPVLWPGLLLLVLGILLGASQLLSSDRRAGQLAS